MEEKGAACGRKPDLAPLPFFFLTNVAGDPHVPTINGNAVMCLYMSIFSYAEIAVLRLNCIVRLQPFHT